MKTIIYKIAVVSLAVFLSGCGVSKVQKQVEDEAQLAKKGPKELPQKNITDFSDSLRCMDELFVTFGFGANTYVMLLEDIRDKTKKVNAGTREMMISALSDMSRRSQALKIIAYGSDSGNLVSFLATAEQKGAYRDVPPYDIIGSISQLDKDIVRKQADLGGQFGGTVDGSIVGGGFGKSASNSASVLGLDLSVITTHDIAVVPGVISRNSVVLYKRGQGYGLDAGISKTGVNYSISGSSTDGTSMALRALVELSAIELIGKLAKLPYWTCLGLDPSHHTIKREISDWYYQLTQSGGIHTEAKVHLYLRGFYNGDINEEITPDYQQAIIAYKERLGLPLDTGMDLDFYTAFLNDTPTGVDASKLAYIAKAKANAEKNPKKKSKKKSIAKQAEIGNAEKAGLTAKAASIVSGTNKPLSMSITSSSVQGVHPQGEDIFLSVKGSNSGFVNCYLESGGVFARIFPNRYSGNGFISKNGLITLPDSPAYSITADTDGEQVHCVLTTRKTDTDLPAKLRLADFDILPIESVNEIFDAYKKASDGRYAYQTYTIKVQ